MLFAAWTALCLSGGSVGRANIVGTPVVGSLDFAARMQNYFDPTNGWVPEGYLNFAGITVTVSETEVEYGYADETAQITANFTATQLIISDHLIDDTYYHPFEMVFTNSDVTSLAVVSDTFASGGLSGSLNEGVIRLDWGGGSFGGGESFLAIFDITLPPPPALGIRLTSTNAALISWPAPSDGYQLQESSHLDSPSWADVPTTPETANGQKCVIVSPPVGTGFYRLKYQPVPP